MPTSDSDRRFGGSIKEMQPVGAQREAKLVAADGAHSRLYRRDHGLVADLQVKKNLGTELLHHLDRCIKAEPSCIAAVGETQIFRPNSDRDVLVDIGSKAPSKLPRHLDAETGLVRPQDIVLPAHSDR